MVVEETTEPNGVVFVTNELRVEAVAVVVVEVGVASDCSATVEENLTVESVEAATAATKEGAAAATEEDFVDEETILLDGGKPNLNPLLTVDEEAVVVEVETAVDEVTTGFSSADEISFVVLEKLKLLAGVEPLVSVPAAVPTVVVSAEDPNPNLKLLLVTADDVAADDPNLNGKFV